MTRGSESRAGSEHGRTFSPGIIVFLVLAVLTAVEYAVATEIDPILPVLVVIALVKAALIVWYFMRVMRTWRSEEGHSLEEAD